MTLRKGVLIALLIASEFVFISCSQQYKNDMDLKPEADALLTKPTNKKLISEYDSIMQRVAMETEMDWRFLAAICYHESRFKDNLTSPVGAIGLMQVMPSVARGFGVSVEEVRKPDVNIATAAKVLKSIEKSMKFSASVSKSDRMRIMLACYNGGIGHIMDACRLASKHGANPTKWEDVERFLKIKGTPQYVQDDAVRCGYFASGETVNFVRLVMSQYDNYRSKFPA